MRAVQTTYCTQEFLNEAYEKRRESTPHKVALRIVENLSNVVIDMTSEELCELVKSNPLYKRLYKRENKTLKAKKLWKNEISFETTTDEVYLVHPDYIKDYKTIRDKTGSLIIASDSDINLLTRMNDKRGYILLVPDEERISILYGGYQGSWEEAIKTCEVKPVNSLIISDNYLFTNIDKRKERSLFSLIKVIVPSYLSVPFHLAIFSYIGTGNFSKDNAENLINEIKKQFPADKIKVTIIIHNIKSITHDREILSNYHIITSGVGFNVIEEGGIREVAKGHIEPVFHSLSTTSENQMGTKHFHFQTIEWLKSIYHKTYHEKRRNGVTRPHIDIVGDKEHRLLD